MPPKRPGLYPTLELDPTLGSSSTSDNGVGAGGMLSRELPPRPLNSSSGVDQQRELLIEGIKVAFPYQPYPLQITYMSKVILALKNNEHALLESPTGTGKTLCLLCASLSFLRAERLRGGGGGGGPGPMGVPRMKPKSILYASRTHAQLSQVIRELKKTAYGREFTMAVLGSRDRLCVHPEVSKITNSTAQNNACAALREDLRCKYYRGVLKRCTKDAKTGNLSANLLSDPTTGGTHGDVLDIEELATAGKAEGYCPYYYQRAVAEKADITFVPYPYIFDSTVRNQLGIKLEDYYLLVDEAHNIPGVVQGANCVDLSSLDLARSVGEVSQALAQLRGDDAVRQRQMQKVQGNADDGIDEDIEAQEANLSTLKLLLCNLEKDVHSERLGVSGEIHHPGTYMLEFLARQSILPGTPAEELLRVLASVVTILTGADVSSAGTQKLIQFLNLIYKVERTDDVLRTAFRFVLQERGSSPTSHNTGANFNDVSVRNLGFWCLDTALALVPVLAPCPSIIMTSGTLSPVAHFAIELGIPFRHILQGDHVIKPDQALALVCCRGPGDVALNCSFNQRHSDPYRTALGMTIVNIARVVRQGGILVFFPSYSVMFSTVDFWKTNSLGKESGKTVWGMLTDTKKVFTEPRASTELDEVVRAFQSEADATSAILLAVCRGKVSEGVDFADRHGRCVILTGIPFANHMDLMVRLKKEYLTSVAAQRPKVNGTLFSGDIWYQQDALRSVNQAIGRVIRHKDDYGCIVLADERFRNQLPLLSGWVRQNLMVKEEFGEVYRSLSQFFSQRTQKDTAALAASVARSEATETARGLSLRAEGVSSNSGDSLAPILATKAHEFFELQRRAEELKEAQKIALDEQERNLAVSNRASVRVESAPGDGFKSSDESMAAKRPSPFTKMKAPQGEKGPNGASSTSAPTAPAAGSVSDEFCIRVKKLLTPEKYQVFRSCLISISTLKKEVSGSTAAKQGQNPTDLVRSGLEKHFQLLKSAFSECQADVRQRLLEDFAAFLPSSFRPQYAQLVQAGKVAEGNLPPGAEVPFAPPGGLKRAREGDA